MREDVAAALRKIRAYARDIEVRGGRVDGVDGVDGAVRRPGDVPPLHQPVFPAVSPALNRGTSKCNTYTGLLQHRGKVLASRPAWG